MPVGRPTSVLIENLTLPSPDCPGRTDGRTDGWIIVQRASLYFRTTKSTMDDRWLEERDGPRTARRRWTAEIEKVGEARAFCTLENIRTSTDISWRVFRTLTEPVPLKYGKLATKYPWIYGYFLQCAALIGRHSGMPPPPFTPSDNSIDIYLKNCCEAFPIYSRLI